MGSCALPRAMTWYRAPEYWRRSGRDMAWKPARRRPSGRRRFLARSLVSCRRNCDLGVRSCLDGHSTGVTVKARPDPRTSMLRQMLRRLGYDVHRHPVRGPLHYHLETLGIDTILDVGANEGRYATSVRAHGFRGRI